VVIFRGGIALAKRAFSCIRRWGSMAETMIMASKRLEGVGPYSNSLLEIAPDEKGVERHPPAVTLERGLQQGVLAHGVGPYREPVQPAGAE
jgi:hypothetical protein